MQKTRIGEHVFFGGPAFGRIGHDSVITVFVPPETDKSVIQELQEATSLEVLDDVGREVIGTHRLFEWRRAEYIYDNNDNHRKAIAITWQTVSDEETRVLRNRVTVVERDTEAVTRTANDLSDAAVELAELIIENDKTEDINNISVVLTELMDAIVELASLINPNENIE